MRTGETRDTIRWLMISCGLLPKTRGLGNPVAVSVRVFQRNHQLTHLEGFRHQSGSSVGSARRLDCFTQQCFNWRDRRLPISAARLCDTTACTWPHCSRRARCRDLRSPWCRRVSDGGSRLRHFSRTSHAKSIRPVNTYYMFSKDWNFPMYFFNCYPKKGPKKRTDFSALTSTRIRGYINDI